MSAKRNATLELFKLIAAYMVVFIHVSFEGGFGVVVDSLARFAVPLFFLISGFFSYGITAPKIKKRIKNIAILIVFSSLLYTAVNLLLLSVENDFGSVAEYFGQYLDIKIWLKLLAFNIPPSSLHLWYLFAALYVYLIFLFVKAVRFRDETVFTVSVLLLILHLLAGEGLSAIGFKVPTLVVRNFAVMGLPFFGLGLMAKKYESRLRAVPNKTAVALALLGSAESVASYCFSGKKELYVGTLPVLLLLAVLFVKYSDAAYPRFVSALSGCSTYIYVFHIMTARLIEAAYPFFGVDPDASALLSILHPLIVCAATTLLSLLTLGTIRSLRKKLGS